MFPEFVLELARKNLVVLEKPSEFYFSNGKTFEVCASPKNKVKSPVVAYVEAPNSCKHAKVAPIKLMVVNLVAHFVIASLNK